MSLFDALQVWPPCRWAWWLRRLVIAIVTGLVNFFTGICRERSFTDIESHPGAIFARIDCRHLADRH